jgi:hypothetical protein
MFKKLFQSPSAGSSIAELHEEPVEAPVVITTRPQSREAETQPKVTGIVRFESFEEIYRSGPSNQPSPAYDIMKIASMLESPHISGMSVESKRGSIMMALEAAGVEPKDILQDAMVRQRALSDYEEAQQKKMRDFESYKGELNRQIQEELDKINAEYLARIQANVNEIAKQQDQLRAWQKSKQHELTVMAEACSYLAPADASANNLAAALDRAARR